MLHFAIQIYVQAFLPLTLLVLWGAVQWGGRTEQVVAWSFALASLTQKCTQGLFAQVFSRIEPTVALVDALLLIILFRMSLRDPRWWVLTASACQLLSTLAHAARMVDFDMSPLAYAILTGTGGYPTQFLLIAGIIEHHARMRRPKVALPRAHARH
jgi:hypothetical protein